MGGAYHWQYRVRDTSGNNGSWISFGSNLETVPDFTVVPFGVAYQTVKLSQSYDQDILAPRGVSVTAG